MKDDGVLRFTFRLARELGMTVGQLERDMSNAEFLQWMAFYAHELLESHQERKGAGK